MKMLILSAALTACALAQPPARPLIGVTVNGGAQARIDPGWPVVVSVSMAAGDEPVKLGLKEGSWLEAVSVILESPDGTSPALTRSARVQPDSVELQDLDMVTAEFVLSPEVTSQLALGAYRVRAVYDPQEQQAEGAWAEQIASGSASFEISQDPPQDEAAHQAARLLILSNWSEIQGDAEQAMAWVDELLTAQPSHYTAKVRKAELLESAGRFTEALSLLDDVEVQLRANFPDATHPPTLIHKRQADLLEKILGGENQAERAKPAPGRI
ncbi:tetratricopeptide repeat protein [Paludibaculum fermentans]|uniref:Tetratricopeptide repeat protein n=1 Tax=Paludibaculum fermentans TaxID=1473598 RepID=A0A7S7NVR0_PALFE|nr:tetratricopeptide repeat protein [Paludibaculum fermentans]QOY90611.1 tetratricopeptide repeat protein [Paludibaculum fermentans]